MYVLERRVVQKHRGRLCVCWERYALCCTHRLLERVRAGQEKPEDWRITKSPISFSQLCHYSLHPTEQKEAS